MHGDTSGVDLHESGVGEISTLAIASHSGRHVAAHGVGRKEVGVAISAGGDYDSVSSEALELAGDEVLGDDTASAFHAILILDKHELVHLIAVVALHFAGLDLTVERRISAEQELLAGLTLGIESTAYLSAAERAVGEQTTIFASEGHTLSHTLVDDIVRHFSQTIYVGFASAVVTTLHGVIEETIYRVAIILIVLGCIDTTLSGDGVSATGAILDAEIEHIESHLCQCRSGRSTGETCADHDDVETTLVSGVYKLLMSLVISPFISDGTLGDLGVRRIHDSDILICCFHVSLFIGVVRRQQVPVRCWVCCLLIRGSRRILQPCRRLRLVSSYPLLGWQTEDSL